MRLGSLLVAALLIGACLFGALAASGAEVGRAEYREAAEPICRRNTEANERILAGVKAEVRDGKLKPAASKFARAAAALKRTARRLEALPRPPVDLPRLAKWFGYVKDEVGYFEAIAARLKAGKKGAAEQLVARLSTTASRANNTVIVFEFDYCRLEPSRFT